MQIASEDLIKDIVGQTSGFMPRDIRALIADAGANLIPGENIQFDTSEPRNLGDTSSSGSKPVQDNKPKDNEKGVLGKENLVKALERSKKRNASALGTPKVNKWAN